MPGAQLYIDCPEILRETVGAAPMAQALAAIGRLAGAEVVVAQKAGPPGAAPPMNASSDALPIQYKGRTLGHVSYDRNGNQTRLADAGQALCCLLEHALDRETAVSDLAEAMCTSYEELNMLYTLMSEIVVRTHAPDIGRVVVNEAARILDCRRVSLMVLDEQRQRLEVLAALGLPEEVRRASLPLAGTIAGQVLFDEDLLLVNDIAERPDLAGKSRGTYTTQSFVVVRVPLLARGEPVGILTATERHDNTEFTSRDRKLVEGLSSLAASALLNCQLHGKVNRQMIGTIKAMACAVDAKDEYTHDHSARVAHLSVQMADCMGLGDPQQCREIELAGLLHDIGKIGISDAVLRKATRLTTVEYEAIKQHPRIGARIVQQVQGLDGVARAILHHHERYDGLGYPAGLRKDEIPLASRLIAAADSFDALISDRPYRKGMGRAEALHELQQNSGTQLAPDAVDAIAEVVAAMEADGPQQKDHLRHGAIAQCLKVR